MKKRLLVASLAALALVAVASVAPAEPRTYQFDRSHSEVGFNVRHFFNKVHGSFTDYSGAIVFDPKSLATSSVEVTIQDSSIYTANEKRDNHLRTEDFFWVEKHPTIGFKSTKVIAGKDAKHFNVAGDLTIRGVTKPVTLAVEYLGSGTLAVQGRPVGTQAGWVATTTINRKDYGIVWNRTVDQGGVMLDDNVEIVLNIAGVSRDETAGAVPAADKPATATADKK